MSQFCKTQLCSTVQNVVTGIENTCDTTDFLFASFSADRIEPTNRISKVTFDDLPDASTVPNGHIAYLDDAKVPIIASNCSWIGLDGRTVGSFAAGCVFSWGLNSCGQLAHGTTVVRTTGPRREMCSATDWCQVSAGSIHTVSLKTSGELWAWGSGAVSFIGSPLGDGTTTDRCSPVREFCSATDWCQVSSGCAQTAALKTSGQLWTWGSNNCGQLGDGTTVSKCSPIREITSSTDWCQVSAGTYHTAAIKTSGEIWSWGRSTFGQLGNGSTTDRCSPVREISSSTDWCQVSAGDHVAAVKTSGQIWSWGRSGDGNLGDGAASSRCSPVREICSATDWCQVSAAPGPFKNTLAIKTSGELWVWGYNHCGQLGDGTTTARCSPVREICSATDWCQVSAGCNFSTAVKTTGTLWAWGSGFCGVRGDGTVGTNCFPNRENLSLTNWCQVSAGCAHVVGLALTLCVCR